MWTILPALLGGLLKLGSELIEDPDKKAEFAYKTLELSNELALKLLDTKTYPWVDALVKLAYAGEQLVKGLIRPLGSFALAAFAAYCDVNGIELNPELKALLYGAPIGWGVSRHIEKGKQAKLSRPAAADNSDPF